jgi:uncharacterized protein YcgI (DUF1989 family)
MKKNIVHEEFIPPKHASAFVVKKDQYVRIIDVEGQQVGDFVLFNEHDYSDKLNPSYTRQWASTFDPETMLVSSMFRGITTGNKLISSLRHVMATITADTPIPAGVHDLVLRMCSRWIYEEAANAGLGTPQDGCLDLLAKVLEPYGIAKGDIPDDINLFMNVVYDPATENFAIREPVSKPGDYFEIRAEMDLLCALSACPDDICSQCNGRAPHPAKPLKVQILE